MSDFLKELEKDVDLLKRHRKCYVNPNLHSLNKRYDELSKCVDQFRNSIELLNQNQTYVSYKFTDVYTSIGTIKNSFKSQIEDHKVNFERLKEDVEKLKSQSILKKIIKWFSFKHAA